MPVKNNEIIQFKFELGTVDNPIIASFADEKARKGRRIEGTASSSVVDSQGHELTQKALQRMAESAVGMTVFLNHSYNVPEDVFGTIEKAWIRKTSDFDAEGKPVFELRTGMAVLEANDRAVKTHDAIIGKPEEGIPGTKLGISIGAMIPEGAAQVSKSQGKAHLVVDDVELVEMSIVGVPANGRSWIDMATKSLKESIEAGDNPDLFAKAQELPDEDTLGDAAKAEVADEPVGAPEPEEGTAEQATVEAEDLAPEDTKKTRVTVWDNDKTIEVDTGRSRSKSGDDHSAQADEPESAGGLPSGETAKSFTTIETPPTLKGLLGQLRARDERIRELEAERDQSIQLAAVALNGTQTVIETLGRTPMGRKTNVDVAKEQFGELETGIYSLFDVEVARMLKSKRGNMIKS